MMKSSNNYFQMILELRQHIDWLNQILKGDNNDEVLIEGIIKPSISKDIADKWSAISAMMQGRRSFETKAVLIASGSPPSDKLLAEVWRDPTPELNGLYGWTGSAWEKSPYDVIQKIVTIESDIANINPLNVSEMENNFALSLSDAIQLVPVEQREKYRRIEFQSSPAEFSRAAFHGEVSDWLDTSFWSVEKIARSDVNRVYYDRANGSTRWQIKAKAKAGFAVIVSSDSFLPAYYNGGYYDSSDKKVGEIGASAWNNSTLDDKTGRYFSRLSQAPENTEYISVFFTSTEAAPRVQCEISNDYEPSLYERPMPYVDYAKFKFVEDELAKKAGDIGELPESKVSTKNLYNPYTRVQVGIDDDVPIYTSDFIEVDEGETYYYSRPPTLNTYYYQVFDSNHVTTRSVFYPYITIESGERYVKLWQANCNTDSKETNLIFADLAARIQLEVGRYPTSYEPYKKLSHYVLNEDLPFKFRSELFSDKNCYCIGDSITNAGYWIEGLKSKISFKTIHNLGRDGCTWSDRGEANNIYGRINQLEATVISNGLVPDLVIIALGTNDWGNLLPIGDYSAVMAKDYNHVDVKSRVTVLDAIKYGVARIRKLYPECKVLLTTPVQRQGKYDTDYINAVIDGGKMMGTPVIDVYGESGLIAFDEWLTLYYQDGLHETALGGQVHGEYVANELINKYFKWS